MAHIHVMGSHMPIRLYIGGLILGINILLLFPMVGKGLREMLIFDRILGPYWGSRHIISETVNLPLGISLTCFSRLRILSSFAPTQGSAKAVQWLKPLISGSTVEAKPLYHHCTPCIMLYQFQDDLLKPYNRGVAFK